jgi:AcrR family transcriptional regulator
VLTKGDRTRRRILDVVVELLETQSYDRMSVEEVTRRAEITRPAFYFHFGSLGAAVAGVLEELLEEFVTVAAAWYEHSGDEPLAGVTEVLEATIALWRSHARLMDAMTRATAVDDEAAELVARWVGGLIIRAAERLRRDLAERLPAEGPSPDALAAFMVGATFDAMRRDVRAIVTTGTPDEETLVTLTYVWTKVLAPGS